MDLGPGLFCKYSNTVNLTLKSMGQINCGLEMRSIILALVALCDDVLLSVAIFLCWL